MTGNDARFGAQYQYRVDGMRVAKAVDGTLTQYRHDGQMGVEDVETSSQGTSVTRYGPGARGVDLIERTNSSGTVTAFPIYDAHGNDVASLTRSGTGFQIGDRRSYDAWGAVRAQQSGGDPKLRYCASLGHKADDESGLVYMRARYYEPSSGRFLSEDPGKQGKNLYTYCNNNPVTRFDKNGTDWAECQAAIFAAFVYAMENSVSPADAVAKFISQATKDIGHYYFVEIAQALQCDAALAANDAMSNFLSAGIPWASEETTDALTSKAAMHRMEATLIKTFGAYEIVLYSLLIELSDPLLGMG